MIVRGAIGHWLAADVALNGFAHFSHQREGVFGAAQAIYAHDVRTGVRESFRDIGGFFAVGRYVFIFEADGDHHGQFCALGSLDGKQSFAEKRKRFTDNEINALGDLYVELLVESLAHAVSRGFIVRLVHPGEAEISGDEAAVFCCFLCDADCGTV